MSRSITIRGLPDEVVDELAARARRSGRSMQEYLKRELAAAAARPDVDAWLARAGAIRELSGGGLSQGGLSAEEILAARDADRR